MQPTTPTSVHNQLPEALFEIYMGLHLPLTPCSFQETWQGPRVPQRLGYSSSACNYGGNYSREAEPNLMRRARPNHKPSYPCPCMVQLGCKGKSDGSGKRN